jgi:hypothetical protein
MNEVNKNGLGVAQSRGKRRFKSGVKDSLGPLNCDLFKRACDDFFRRREMPVGGVNERKFRYGKEAPDGGWD